LTYAEIAEALRLPSAKAGEAKARRAKWQRTIGNDGFARVAVPLSVLEEPYPHRRANRDLKDRPSEGPAKGLQDTSTINALLDEVRAAYEQASAELRRRAETAEQRAERAEAEAAGLRERVTKAEAETVGLREQTTAERARADAAEQEATRLRAEVAALRQEILGERERANEGLARVTEVARLQEGLVAERERANAAFERALEAEARLAAGTPGARALKALRAFLARQKRP
jgi:chromosome segregation ATPase